MKTRKLVKTSPGTVIKRSFRRLKPIKVFFLELYDGKILIIGYQREFQFIIYGNTIIVLTTG